MPVTVLTPFILNLDILQVKQMTVQMQEARETASQAEEMLENEQIEKRTLEEQLSEITVSYCVKPCHANQHDRINSVIVTSS